MFIYANCLFFYRTVKRFSFSNRCLGQNVMEIISRQYIPFQVLTLFGLKFSITPLLEEIGIWIMTTLNAENFGRMIDMMHMLKELGFSEQNLANKIPLTGLDQVVTEFVNNSSREDFTNLLTAEFNELDMVILKALFRSENNHFDILLNTLAEKIESEDVSQPTDVAFRKEGKVGATTKKKKKKKKSQRNNVYQLLNFLKICLEKKTKQNLSVFSPPKFTF